jgi:hypothetical protein
MFKKLFKHISVATAAFILGTTDGRAEVSVIWDFLPENENGWTTINGVAWLDASGVTAGQGDGAGVDAYFGGINGTGNTRRAHDGAHVNFIYRSPTINFGSVDTVDSVLEIDWIGGQGNQGGSNAPTNPGAMIGVDSSDAGQKGLALLNLTSGNYDAIYYKAGNGSDVETTALTQADLTTAGVSLTDDYQLDFFENDDGGWGWSTLSAVRLDAAAIGESDENLIITEVNYSPEGNSLTLTWDSGVGKTYAVKFSRDMIDWSSDLNSLVMADEGEQTTRVFDLADAGLVGEGRVFFRVERQTIE